MILLTYEFGLTICELLALDFKAGGTFYLTCMRLLLGRSKEPP